MPERWEASVLRVWLGNLEIVKSQYHAPKKVAIAKPGLERQRKVHSRCPLFILTERAVPVEPPVRVLGQPG
jgi:hypothetical protein